MRPFLAILVTATMAALVFAADNGTRPRPSSADYPVSRPAKTATIGAVLVTPDQIKRMFPADLNKKYAVVEVAIYPQAGEVVDIKSLDFGLQFGTDVVRYPATPQDIAAAWREKRDPPSLGNGVEVTTETGVTYGSGIDPATGQRTRGWSTYEGVGVGVGRPSNVPPPPPGYNPNVIEAVAQEKALPEGKTSDAVAGYLYFPLPSKKHKGDALELKYSKDGASVKLPLPAK
jgi:hypothetical protein